MYQVLKNEEKLVAFPDHLLELDNARVAQPSQALHFTQSHAFLPRRKLPFHSLDSDLQAKHTPFSENLQRCIFQSLGRISQSHLLGKYSLTSVMGKTCKSFKEGGIAALTIRSNPSIITTD